MRTKAATGTGRNVVVWENHMGTDGATGAGRNRVGNEGATGKGEQVSWGGMNNKGSNRGEQPGCVHPGLNHANLYHFYGTLPRYVYETIRSVPNGVTMRQLSVYRLAWWRGG